MDRRHFSKLVMLRGGKKKPTFVCFFHLAAKNEADRQAEKREIKRRLTRKVLQAAEPRWPSGRAVGVGGGREVPGCG